LNGEAVDGCAHVLVLLRAELFGDEGAAGQLQSVSHLHLAVEHSLSGAGLLKRGDF